MGQNLLQFGRLSPALRQSKNKILNNRGITGEKNNPPEEVANEKNSCSLTSPPATLEASYILEITEKSPCKSLNKSQGLILVLVISTSGFYCLRYFKIALQSSKWLGSVKVKFLHHAKC